MKVYVLLAESCDVFKTFEAADKRRNEVEGDYDDYHDLSITESILE
jgi:hypothetical protein